MGRVTGAAPEEGGPLAELGAHPVLEQIGRKAVLSRPQLQPLAAHLGIPDSKLGCLFDSPSPWGQT